MDPILAQAASSTDFLAKVAEYGLLGLLFAISLIVIRKLFNDLSDERKGRLEDARAFTVMVKESTEATVRWTAAQEERNRAMTEMAETLKNLGQIK